MIVFIILVFIQSAILDCDEFIPPALQFDDSIYFDNTSKSNIIFIDYQQLIIYDLCYDENKNNTFSGKNNEKVTFCLKKKKKSVEIYFNNSSTLREYENFNVSFNKNTTPKSVKLTFPDNHSLVLLCNNESNILNEINTTYIQNENNIVICGRRLIFQYILYNQCGIFGYYLIFFGLFNLIYGYQNKRFTFSIYAIFFLIRIAGEIIDEISNFLISINSTIISIILIVCFVLGSVFGYVLSPKFEYQKAILSFLVGDILYNFIFYGICVPSQLIDQNEFKVLLLVSCIIFTFLIFFFFIKDEVKSEKIINGAISAAGSYLLLVGVKYICGGIPLEQGLLLFQKTINNYNALALDDKNILEKMKEWIYFFGFGISFLVLWLIGIVISNVKSESKREIDTEKPSEEEKSTSEM